MTKPSKIQRKQLLQEADGYLDLLMIFDERWEPSPQVRDRIAQRALDVLDQLGETSGSKSELMYLRGQAYRAMHRFQDALEPLEAASQLDPENIHIWLALGWCYKRYGRIDLAIQALEQSLSFDGSAAILHYNLACYWSLSQNSKQAVGYLSRAFDIDSKYRELVAEEADFAAVRDHPDFMAITSVIV